jgi:hypothetical protein
MITVLCKHAFYDLLYDQGNEIHVCIIFIKNGDR